MSAPTQLTDALAFLYLAFGQVTDGALKTEEMRTLATKLQQRMPGIELSELGQLLRNTVEVYKGYATRDDKVAQAQLCAGFLRSNVDDKMRVAILDDLVAIAYADGEVSADEQAFIANTADTLGVPMPKA